MDIQDVPVFQDLVKPGYLMVHKHMEKKILSAPRLHFSLPRRERRWIMKFASISR